MKLEKLTQDEWLTITLIHESCFDMDGKRQECVCKVFEEYYNLKKNQGKDVSYFDNYVKRLKEK